MIYSMSPLRIMGGVKVMIMMIKRMTKTFEQYFFKGIITYFVLQLILYIILCVIITFLVIMITRMNMSS